MPVLIRLGRHCEVIARGYRLSHHSLCLQEELLVEGLRFVPPLVAPAPAPMPARLEGEVQQVVQADLLGSRELGRAELGPLNLCYLERERTRAALMFGSHGRLRL